MIPDPRVPLVYQRRTEQRSMDVRNCSSLLYCLGMGAGAFMGMASVGLGTGVASILEVAGLLTISVMLSILSLPVHRKLLTQHYLESTDAR